MRDVVRDDRTATAAFVGAGLEHEVVDDELLAAFEQVEEIDAAMGTGEDIGLGHFDHGEGTALGGNRCGQARGFFLLYEKLLAGFEPFG